MGRMKKIEQERSRKLNLLHLKKKKNIKFVSLDFLRQKNKKLFGKDVVDVPVYVDLIKGDEKVCDVFFENLRLTLERNPTYIYLSFKKTQILKATSILMLYSIIDHAREINGATTKIGIIWSKKSKNVNSIIKGSGLFLRAQQREEMITHATKLPVIMGDNQRVTYFIDKFIDYILAEHYKDAPAEKEQQIASAIQETLENVGRHAYPTTKNHHDKKWWFCCDRVGDNLFIVIYDSGIGIPDSFSDNNAVMLTRVNSLYPDECKGSTHDSIKNDSKTKRISAYINVQMLKKKLNDGQLIRAAMHVDVTSIDLNQHGQGSKSIKGLITDNENSFLLMYSNYGFYRYSKDREDNEQCVSSRKHCIPGTLIQWSI